MWNLAKFVNSLKGELEKELPGEEKQYKMAPDLREAQAKSFNSVKTYTQSGVLLLIYNKLGEINISFIKRPEYDGPHSGQVSLPGGKHEKGDKDLIDTALRETYEEIGVLEENIEVIGTLSPLKIPVSRIEVLPVIGFSEYPPLFKINSKEVEYLIEVKLADLLDVSNIKEMTLFAKGNQIKAPYYYVSQEKIWGATAMMLSEFLEIVRRIF